MSNGDALARAREIAARLSGSLGSSLGKRKSDENGGGHPGLGSIQRKKIYIPKDNTDINFLGLLIGPKGSSQKAMQERTGAKIIIRGRGASKDGGPSNTGHEDDNDELHVTIEGTPEALEKAAKEVEGILFNPEEAQRIKGEQLRNLAGMNGSGGSGGSADNIYGPGSSGGSGGALQAGQEQIELRVPNNMVGLIIGRGGENIIKIQSQLGVVLQVAKEHEMLPGDTTRSIIVKGSASGVNEAKGRIDDIIASQLMKQGGGGAASMVGGATLQSRDQLKDMNSAFIVRLPVPNDKVGIIIGKGGMTIRGIQDRSQTNIQIPNHPDEDDSTIRTINIGGETKEAVDAAQIEIYNTLQMQQQQQQQQQGAFSAANTTYMVVPDDRVGLIIGKGGSTIKDIQSRLRVHVQIPHVADAGSIPPSRTLSITGAAEMQPQAKYEIEMIVAGTPVNGGSRNDSYGQQQQYGGGASGYYGGGAHQGMYGAGIAQMYGADPYAQQQYGAAVAAGGYDMNAYYAQMAAYAAAQQGTTAVAAATGTTGAGATATEEVPTDPTAYYNDYWQYASYYGEAAARLYYGAWSPPEGTAPPAGVVVAADPTGDAAAAAPPAPDAAVPPPPGEEAPASAPPASEDASAVALAEAQAAAVSTESSQSTQAAQSGAESDPAWEAYAKQYREWYEAHGKAAGADPNPPRM